MPYIKQEDRKRLEDRAVILARLCNTPGELNFVISVMLREQTIPSYSKMNELLGVLEAAKQEYYRVVVAPYETTKELENGPVFCTTPDQRLKDLERRIFNGEIRCSTCHKTITKTDGTIEHTWGLGNREWFCSQACLVRCHPELAPKESGNHCKLCNKVLDVIFGCPTYVANNKEHFKFCSAEHLLIWTEQLVGHPATDHCIVCGKNYEIEKAFRFYPKSGRSDLVIKCCSHDCVVDYWNKAIHSCSVCNCEMKPIPPNSPRSWSNGVGVYGPNGVFSACCGPECAIKFDFGVGIGKGKECFPAIDAKQLQGINRNLHGIEEGGTKNVDHEPTLGREP